MIPEDNDRTYVRYEETESLASITPSVVYEDPQNYCDPLSTKLHKWAFRGDVSKIKKNLKKNEVNAEDEKRRTPLHMGAYEGHVKVISLLLSSGANPESEDKDGRTPVLKAVEKGHVEAVQTFLKHKVNIHAKDYYGNSALHLACKSNSKNLVEILLECGIDLNQQNMRGRTPLYRAVEHQDNEIKNRIASSENGGYASTLY
ncbi:Serine/threonine-protein phosphatase 6 regulatory ankyrin repeat subunit A, partial [Armadillidium vulgare]